MALKDWKKITNENDFIQWGNNTDRFVFVYKQNYTNSKPSHWVFAVEGARKTYLEKNTKTKAQALRYAKSYMRRH